jgi:cytochrome c553
MSKELARYVKSKKKTSPEEEKALASIRKEAAKAGTTLESDGEGGLSSSLVLGVMRRDKYTCKVCGGKENIGVHHKGGIVKSKWLSQMGHKSTPENLVTICASCHDNVHEDARAEGVDSSQVTPEGDK